MILGNLETDVHASADTLPGQETYSLYVPFTFKFMQVTSVENYMVYALESQCFIA